MPDTPADTREPQAYEPPRLHTLGTLAELTLGDPSGGEEDAFDGFENSTGPT